MTYPIAVIIVALIVSAILLIKVVPQFQSVFQGFGAELPAFTQMVVNLSEFLQEWWLAVIVGVGAIGFTFKELHKRSKKFRDALDRTILKLPIFGGIVYKSAVARYARTLSTTFAAGVPWSMRSTPSPERPAISCSRTRSARSSKTFPPACSSTSPCAPPASFPTVVVY